MFNTNVIKYIVSLTPRKQVMAVLLVAITVMASIIIYENREVSTKDKECEAGKELLREEIRKKDSLILVIQERANKEVNNYLIRANEELKSQLKEVNSMNKQSNIIVNTNEKILKKLKNVRK